VSGNNISLGVLPAGTHTYKLEFVQDACYSPGNSSGFITFANATHTIKIYPVPDISKTPVPQAICSDETASIEINSDVAYSTFDLEIFSTSPETNDAGYEWVGGKNPLPVTVTDIDPDGIYTVTTQLKHNHNAPVAVTYRITPTSPDQCVGEYIDRTVVVNPVPVVGNETDEICSGGTFTVVPDPDDEDNVIPAGTTYTWSAPSVTSDAEGGTITGGVAGSGSSITGTLTNTSTSIQTATYTVIPKWGDCEVGKFTVIVTVNPTPVLSSPEESSACSGVLFDSYTAASATPGTTFTWSRAKVTNITPETGSGTDANIEETLVNATADPIEVEYVFTLTANGCTNEQKVKVMVNPKPTLLSTTTTPICSGEKFEFTANSATAGVTYSWKRLDNLNISGTPTSESNGTISEPLTNTSTSPVDVKYEITLTANGCSNKQEVTVTVNPTPVLSSEKFPSICSGTLGATTPSFVYDATSETAGTTFTWSRAFEAGISPITNGSGLNGEIKENLINNTAEPIDVKYVFTLTANGCTNTQTVTVKVYPRPTLLENTGTPICSGAEFNFTAESETAGVTYSWERLDNLNIKEAPTTGTGASIKDEVLTNTSRNNVTVTYKFTLTANGCSNTSDVTVTVYPTPTLYSNLNPPTAFCSGSTIEYNAVSLTQGTVTYSWKRLTGLERGIDGGASSGTGTGAKIEEKLTNTTSSTVDVKYEMTLTLTNTIDDVEYKCTNQQTVTIKVSPQPAIGNMAASICNNGTFTVIPKDNDDDGEGDGIVPSNTTYTWGVPVVTGGVKGGAAGTGSFTSGITGTLINPTTEEQTATYTVTPTSGDCPGSPFEVVVTVMPDVKIISDDEGETCNNELYIYTAESSTTHDVTFAWKRAKVTGITNDAASDNSATIEEKLYNDGVNPVYVEYKITPYYKGCPGTEFTHTVTVYPTPTLSSSRSSTICSSSSANFIYTPASLTDNVSFSWERLPAPGLTTTELEQGDGNISHVLRNFTSAQITVTYRYTLTIDGTDGCKNEQDVEVKINPEPVITKDQEVQACSDAAINYQIELDNFENPDDGVTFTWSAPVLSPVSTDFTGGSARSTASAANITDSFHNATGGIGTATYTVTPYKDGCPGEAVTIVVTVGAEPVLADLDKTVCSDEAIALTLGVAAGSIDAAYYNIIEVKPTFGLTADGGNASWPNGNVEADYLEDDKYTNNTNGSLTVTYRVQPMINGTCYGDEKDIVITVLPALKSGSITPPTPLTICAGEDVAEIVGTSATGGNGDYTYTWYYTTNLSAAAGDASWVEITGANEASYNPGILTVSTNYIRKVSDSKCEVVRYSNIVKITVNPLPVTSTIAGPELLCDDAIDVIYRVEDHPNTVYEWTVTDANGIFSFVFKEGKNFMIVNAVPGASGTATIKVREQNTKTGCWSEPVEKRVTVSPVLPGDDIIGPDEVCEGATNVRYAVANKDGSENSVYKWTAPGAYIIGDDDKHEIFVTFGSISGVVISVVETPLGGGCPTTHNSKTVTVNPSPRVFNVTAPVAYCADDNGVTITLSGSETGTTYQLFKNGVEDGDPVDGTTGSSLTWDDRTAGEYTVVATRNGCEKEMNGTVTPAVNTVDPGSIGGNQTVCLNGVPSAFTSDEDAEDTSDGTIIYQWEISTDGGSSFSEIRGANLADYTHMSRLTDDVKFRRWASSTVYSASGTSNPCREVSNVIDVKVDNFNPGTIKEDGQIICSGAIPGKFTSDIAPVADEGELSYQWMYSTDGLIYNNVADGTDEEYASGALTADTWFKRMVISTLSDGSFCTKETNPVYVQVISVVPGIVGSAQDICYGTVPAMLTGRSAGGDAPFNYQWEQSTDESLWTAIEDETGLTYQPEALTQDTWYRIRVISQQDKDESCPQYTTSVKITVVNLNAGKIGEDQIVCENGTPDALNVITPASGDDDDGNFGYQWQYSTDNIYFYNVPLATAQTYTPGALTEDTWYRLQVTSIVGTAQCPAYTDTVWIHVNNVNPGEIGEDQFICENGTPLEITSIAAAVVDGDPSYKWEWSPDNTPGSVWTEIEDETGPAYQPAALTQDTYFRRVAVSTAADGTECEMATEPVKITVVNIDPGTIGRNQDICLGDVAQPIRGLTAPLVDGGEPVFSWFKSEDSGASWDVINGATGANYTPLNVTKDTWYKRRVTSSLPGNCFKDNDPVIIRVIEFNAGSLGSDRIVCEGEAPEAFDITAPSGNHTYTYTYQWLYSHDDSWYREIATTEEYTPGALTQDTWYVRKVTATLNDTKFCDKADKVYVQVVNFDPGTIYPEKQVICYGDTPTPITGSEASGDGDFNYQWEYRTATSAWTPISGATDWASYIPDPDMLTEDIWYRRIATSELKESCTLSSNEVRIIINKVDGGTIGSDGAVCYGAAPEEFTSETDGSGSGTAISYRWYKSTNGTDFTPIYSGDATSATYTSDEPLYADTWFIRQTISVLDNKTCTANSNEIKITVNPLPVGTISGGTTICPGDEATITVEISAGTAPFEVVIANLGTRTLTAGTNTFKVSPAAGTVTEYRITSITDANNCVAADITGSAIIIVRKELSIDTQPEAVEICESEPAIFSVSATDADSYQWFVKTPETGIFVAVPGETNSELRLNVTRDMDGYEYHVVVTGCGDTETSNDVTLTVNTAPSVTQPQNSQVCEDNEAEFTVTAAGTGSFTYQWQVNTGSGFTDIADNEPFSGAETATLTISKTPLAYNNYQFQVIVSGECGTVTSQRARLTVNKKPEITLQPEDAGICANGGPVTFEGTASGVTSYKWQERVPGGNWTDINDGGMYSGTATPWLTLNNIPLSANGNKYQLVFIASCGNITSKEVLLTVHENPVVNLSPTLDVCATEPTELDGNPTGGSGNYISHVWSGSGAWLLNDRSVQKPVFTSVAAGTFTLTYIVTDSEGCTASASIEITVEKPDATFTHIVRDGCTPLEVKFVRNMTGVDEFEWDYGDGTPVNTTEASPEHTFINTGTSIIDRTVTLKVKSAAGCIATYTSTVRVYPAFSAAFTMSTDTVCSGDAVAFTAIQGARQYYWDFGDGEGGISPAELESHIYNNPGQTPRKLTVELTTTSIYGCTSTTFMELVVMPKPDAEFEANPPSQIYSPQGNTVAFTDRTNPGNWTYLWDFGDGTTSAEQHPEHLYTTSGEFEVTLTVSNESCSDAVTHTVKIAPPAPVASFDPVPSGCAPLVVTLNNTSLNTDVPGTTYLWNFGDGSASTARNPNYTYLDAGIYKLELTVTGPGGTSTASQIVHVYASPKAYFEVTPEYVFANDERVRMFNLTTGADTYLWEFGDGDTSTVKEPYHRYMESGEYDITLWAYSANGCSDMYVMSPGVTVEPAGDLKFATVFRPNLSGPIERTDLPTGGSETDQFFYPSIRDKVIDFKMQVYSRLGVLIFETSDINVPWNGYYNGQLCAQGVYVWLVEGKYANGQPFRKTGDITLLH
jgi:PKD repeat protein